MRRTRARAAASGAPAAARCFGTLSAGEAHTLLQLLLPWLPPDARARAAAVSRAWRDAAACQSVWARLDLSCGCANSVDAPALAALCARAGVALVELRLPRCPLLCTAAVLHALEAGGCVGLRTLALPVSRLGSGEYSSAYALPPLALAGLVDAAALRRACPALEDVSAVLLCTDVSQATAAQLYPGASLTLLVPFDVLQDLPAAALCHSAVAGLTGLGFHTDAGLTEEQGVALAAAALPRDAAQCFNADGTAVRASLADLELVGVGLGDATAGVLAAALRAPRCALEALAVQAGTMTDAGAAALADALAGNTSLRSLRLLAQGEEPVRLGDAAAGAIAAAIRVNGTLHELRLSGEFSEDATAALFAALTGHAVLRTLFLLNADEAPISGVVGDALGTALRAPGCRLETLVLTARGGIAAEASAAFGAGLAANTSLRILKFVSFADVPAPQRLATARAFRSALLANTTLTSLTLRADLDGRAAAALAPALASHPSLTHVDLALNAIGDTGAVALACALAAPTCALQELEISSCHIGKRGGEALAAALPSNMRLETLRVNDNPGVQGDLDALGTALRSCGAASRLRALAVDNLYGPRALSAVGKSSITSLTLDHFAMWFMGTAAALAAVLSSPGCVLRKLSVMRNGAPNRLELTIFASGLSRNTSLTWLCIDGSSMNPENAALLGRVLRHHPRLAVLNLLGCYWYQGAGRALLHALCAAESNRDDSCCPLAMLRMSRLIDEERLLSDEEWDECLTLMESRQPYPLTLL